MKEEMELAGWITQESMIRLISGGNCRGAVSVHRRKSPASRIPVYVKKDWKKEYATRQDITDKDNQ